MTLPAPLAAAVEAWLAAEAPSGRKAATAALTSHYREGGASAGVDFGAYLVTRLPATYAAAARVLAEIATLRPGFAPLSLLDAGSGPGTVSWAAAGQWPSLADVTFLDSDRNFLALAAALAAHGPEPLAKARGLKGSLDQPPPKTCADLVVAAYALAELPEVRAAAAASALWANAAQMLAIIEPGTPRGFARIRAVRQALLAQGAVPVAPCPHAAACPVVGEDWCHFTVRLARSRAHMHAKGASVPFEDESFSYMVFARDGAASGGGRILSPPRHAKPGVTFRLCTEQGIETRQVAKRDAASYKRVRHMDWGDLL